jgi:hypothetical protein
VAHPVAVENGHRLPHELPVAVLALVLEMPLDPFVAHLSCANIKSGRRGQ